VLGTISGSSLNVDRNATIGGGLTVTGAVLSLSNITAKGTLSGKELVVSKNASISGSLLVKNNIAAKGTVSGATITGFGLGTCNGAAQKLIYNYSTQKFECATDLDTKWSTTGSLMTAFDRRYVNQSGDTMTGNLVIGNSATLSVSGAIITEGDLTINQDAGAVDAILTFGNNTANQTIKYLNASQRFQFSKGISVLGTISGSSLNVDRNATIGGALTASGAIRTKSSISGSTLTVDGDVTIHGQTYNFPTSQTTNGYLKTDGAGNLAWSATASIGNSSGFLISLHPEYPNAIYFSSGSSFIGQLTASGGVAGVNENYYHWTSSKAALNDYWISIRLRVPDNFGSWDPVKPIELRYRTADATATNNHVTVRMKDTADAIVALSGNAGLASATFATANIGITGGTWAPKGHFTVYVKMSALTGKFAEAGYLNLNFESTMP
jgi:cytoskeletal protein CcmA (bactofilin family)